MMDMAKRRIKPWVETIIKGEFYAPAKFEVCVHWIASMVSF